MVGRLRGSILHILFALSVLASSLLLAYSTEPRWVAIMVAAALAYGFISPLVAARRLQFLAAASSHSALLAAVLAVPLAFLVGFLSEYLWAILLGLGLIYIVGYAIYRGVDPDTATSIFVAATASTSILAIYYVLTEFPLETNLWAIMVGDPLLASWRDVFYALAISSTTALAVLLTYREQVYVGIDRELARLSGLRVRFYDWLLFTLLGLTAVALIKVVGFVLEHVLILLPSAIATKLSHSSKGVLAVSVSVSLLASLAGLYLSLLLDQSPAGMVGLILLAIYLAVLISRR